MGRARIETQKERRKGLLDRAGGKEMGVGIERVALRYITTGEIAS